MEEAAAFIANAIHETRPEEDAGCEEGSENRESELCAAWKAADAAQNAANYAWASILISALGTAFLFLTLRETRKTARAELRAYLFPVGITLFDGVYADVPEVEESVPRAVIDVRNFGATPAYDVLHAAELVLVPKDKVDLLPTLSAEGAAPTGIAPHDGVSFKRYLSVQEWPYCPTPIAIHEIGTGQLVFVVNGQITYKDTFRKRRTTNYRVAYAGKWPPPSGMRMVYCNSGNSST